VKDPFLYQRGSRILSGRFVKTARSQQALIEIAEHTREIVHSQMLQEVIKASWTDLLQHLNTKTKEIAIAKQRVSTWLLGSRCEEKV
jgi:predicted GNAT family acetyltransferase